MKDWWEKLNWQDLLIGGGVLVVLVKTWDWVVRAMLGSKLKDHRGIVELLRNNLSRLEARVLLLENRVEEERELKQRALEEVDSLKRRVYELETELKVLRKQV